MVAPLVVVLGEPRRDVSRGGRRRGFSLLRDRVCARAAEHGEDERGKAARSSSAEAEKETCRMGVSSTMVLRV